MPLRRLAFIPLALALVLAACSGDDSSSSSNTGAATSEGASGTSGTTGTRPPVPEGFTVVDRDRSKGLYFVRYSNPDLDAKKEKGWLDKLAFWKSDDVKPEQYRVVVTQADPKSVVTVQDPAGAPDKSVNSDKILALLKDQLK